MGAWVDSSIGWKGMDITIFTALDGTQKEIGEIRQLAVLLKSIRTLDIYIN